MKVLQLLPIGKLSDGLVPFLQAALQDSLQVPCEVLPPLLDPGPAFHADRRQYHSSELLARMQSLAGPSCWRILGITDLDLYIPILTFVFGEAQIDGTCAVVSAWRLRQEFYSLPQDRNLLHERVLKEAIHEIGHTCDLTHCDDYSCAMASSHAVEWIDLKNAALCSECREQLLSYQK